MSYFCNRRYLVYTLARLWVVPWLSQTSLFLPPRRKVIKTILLGIYLTMSPSFNGVVKVTTCPDTEKSTPLNFLTRVDAPFGVTYAHTLFAMVDQRLGHLHQYQRKTVCPAVAINLNFLTFLVAIRNVVF